VKLAINITLHYITCRAEHRYYSPNVVRVFSPVDAMNSARQSGTIAATGVQKPVWCGTAKRLVQCSLADHTHSVSRCLAKRQARGWLQTRRHRTCMPSGDMTALRPPWLRCDSPSVVVLQSGEEHLSQKLMIWGRRLMLASQWCLFPSSANRPEIGLTFPVYRIHIKLSRNLV